jgi:hypothetical protein
MDRLRRFRFETVRDRGSSVPVRQRIASAIWDNLAHVPGALLLMLASAAVLVRTFRPGRPAGA